MRETMYNVEFEVLDALPPKSKSEGSIWVNDNESERVIKLRKEVFKHFHRNGPFTNDIKLEIDIWTPEPEGHEKPGDLDNFIKGVCDSLYRPKSSLLNPNFPLHKDFELPENEYIHPENFEIINDDEYIIEIKARMNFIELGKEPHYRIRIEGS